MKILSIGTDYNLFDKESAVRSRSIFLAEGFEETHIVVFSKHIPSGVFKEKVNDKLYLYPVRSHLSLLLMVKVLGEALLRGIKIKRGCKDVYVTCQDPFESGFVGFFVSVFCRIKLQFQIHTDLFDQGFINFSLRNRVRSLFARIVLKKANSIRVVSNRIKNAILDFYEGAPVAVLPVFCDIKEFEVKDRSYNKKSPTILMMSRLEKEKNIYLGINAFKRFLNFYPDSKLIIAGKGGLRDSLDSLVKFLSLEKNVSFVGWERNTKKLFAKADIFLHTSYYEGFGLVFLEAAGSLLPIVSTDVGIAEELGIKVSSYDPGVIALNLKEVSENPTIQVGRQNYKQYVLRKEEYLRFYRESFKM